MASGKGPSDWKKKRNTIPIFKKEDPGNYQLARLTSTPMKTMEEILLEDMSKRMKEQKVMRGITAQEGQIVPL